MAKKKKKLSSIWKWNFNCFMSCNFWQKRFIRSQKSITTLTKYWTGCCNCWEPQDKFKFFQFTASWFLVNEILNYLEYPFVTFAFLYPGDETSEKVKWVSMFQLQHIFGGELALHKYFLELFLSIHCYAWTFFRKIILGESLLHLPSLINHMTALTLSQSPKKGSFGVGVC